MASFTGIMLIIASLGPIKHNHLNPGKILPQFYVRTILAALKWRDIQDSLIFTDFLFVSVNPPGYSFWSTLWSRVAVQII